MIKRAKDITKFSTDLFERKIIYDLNQLTRNTNAGKIKLPE